MLLPVFPEYARVRKRGFGWLPLKRACRILIFDLRINLMDRTFRERHSDFVAKPESIMLHTKTVHYSNQQPKPGFCVHQKLLIACRHLYPDPGFYLRN